LRANIQLWRNVIEVEAVLNSDQAPPHDDAQLSLFVNMQLRPDEKVIWSGRINRKAAFLYREFLSSVSLAAALILMFGLQLIFGRHYIRSDLAWFFPFLGLCISYPIVLRVLGPISNAKDTMFAITDQRVMSLFPYSFMLLISPFGVPTKAEQRWDSRILFTNPSILNPRGKPFRFVYTVRDPARVVRLTNDAIESARLRTAPKG
jgi:hypothetical protein